MKTAKKRGRGRPRKNKKIEAEKIETENFSAENFDVESVLTDEKPTEKMPEGVAENESYVPAEIVESETPPENAENKLSAQMIVGMTESVSVMILGAEMTMTDSERAALCESWETYLESIGGVNLPPWAGLAVANATYFLTRAQNDKVKERLFNIWDKIAGNKKPKETPVDV